MPQALKNIAPRRTLRLLRTRPISSGWIPAEATTSGYIDVAKLDTEIAILKSSTLAMATIVSLHLDQNKDFLPPGSNYAFDLSKIRDRHALIGIFEGGLAAERYGHTNILDLSYTARNPQLAADICNTLIANYVEHNFSQNYAATQQVSDWLQRQLGDLRKRLEASQEHMLYGAEGYRPGGH